ARSIPPSPARSSRDTARRSPGPRPLPAMGSRGAAGRSARGSQRHDRPSGLVEAEEELAPTAAWHHDDARPVHVPAPPVGVGIEADLAACGPGVKAMNAGRLEGAAFASAGV